jgi:hypothetical protein
MFRFNRRAPISERQIKRDRRRYSIYEIESKAVILIENAILVVLDCRCGQNTALTETTYCCQLVNLGLRTGGEKTANQALPKTRGRGYARRHVQICPS